MQKTVVLLDSHAILHRSYHAFPNLRNPAGEPSGALFGMMQMIIRILTEFKPHAIVACFDLPGGTFRHDAFDGYKGTRGEADDALVIQLERAHDLVRAWNIPIIEVPGFEADDCIGTLSQRLHKQGYRVIIASGDRDTLQLVHDDDVVVWTLGKTVSEVRVFNEQAVREYYGFGPELVVDYKALAGDASDNIPGIRGIGDKTARALVGQIGGIQTLYETLEHHPERFDGVVTKRMVELLRAGREDVEFSLVLATIRDDVPVDYVVPSDDWSIGTNYETVLSYCRQYAFTSLLKKIETLFGKTASDTANASGPGLFDTLSSDAQSMAQSIDPVQLRRLQIMRWVLDSRVVGSSLHEMMSWSGATDVEGLEQVLLRELESHGSLYVWQEIEQPIMPIVQAMCDRGMMLDNDVLTEIRGRVQGRATELQAEIYELAGFEFNIQSPKQLGDVLFEKLQLPTKGVKRNKSGGYSTQESELDKLAGLHPIIDRLLEYRGVAKLLSTYIDAFPTYVQSDGRIHARFLQDGAATGRFACQDPNLQNIPIRSELGREIRRAFTVPDGYTLVRFDYSQIELRLVALLARETAMLKLFQSGDDIHTAVAARVFGVDRVDVTRDMRRRAKTINFGILYGMGISALSADLGITRNQAQEFMDSYFIQFPALHVYFDAVTATARDRGYTETLFGRRRYMSEFGSANPGLRAYADRVAMNAPVQGTAADVMKLGMRSAADVVARYPGTYIIAQVHDELLFEVPTTMVADFIPDMRVALESVLQVYRPNVADLVPLLTECETGQSWGTTKPVDSN